LRLAVGVPERYAYLGSTNAVAVLPSSSCGAAMRKVKSTGKPFVTSQVNRSETLSRDALVSVLDRLNFASVPLNETAVILFVRNAPAPVVSRISKYAAVFVKLPPTIDAEKAPDQVCPTRPTMLSSIVML
jgi:hypothetical protein